MMMMIKQLPLKERYKNESRNKPQIIQKNSVRLFPLTELKTTSRKTKQEKIRML